MKTHTITSLSKDGVRAPLFRTPRARGTYDEVKAFADTLNQTLVKALVDAGGEPKIEEIELDSPAPSVV